MPQAHCWVFDPATNVSEKYVASGCVSAQRLRQPAGPTLASTVETVPPRAAAAEVGGPKHPTWAASATRSTFGIAATVAGWSGFLTHGAPVTL